MVKKELILTLFVLALFLFSCAAPESVPKTTEPTDQPVTVTKDDSGTTVKQTTTKTTTSTKTMTAEVKDLLELHKNIKSVKFTKDPSTDPQTFYIKGDQYKKTVARSGKYTDPSDNYDMIYVDRAAQKAYAYCSDLSTVKCPEQYRNEAYEHDFDREDAVLPFDILSSITYAEKVGQETIENRNTIIIQYTNSDGQKERLSLDNYYGFIFKQSIYNSNDQVIESHSFVNVAFNSLTDSEVSLPEGLEIK